MSGSDAPYHAHIYSSAAERIGEPLALDTSVLDPPGVNQGVARFGKSDF